MRAIQQVYSEPKSNIGCKPLLFDRLIDENPTESMDAPSLYFLTQNELVDSIIYEISQVLNTRLTAKENVYAELEDNTLNFGLPSLFGLSDFNSFDAVNPQQWKRISILCKRAISFFEPRITNVSVKVEVFNPLTQSLNIIVTGDMILNKIRTELNFPVVLSCGNAR